MSKMTFYEQMEILINIEIEMSRQEKPSKELQAKYDKQEKIVKSLIKPVFDEQKEKKALSKKYFKELHKFDEINDSIKKQNGIIENAKREIQWIDDKIYSEHQDIFFENHIEDDEEAQKRLMAEKEFSNNFVTLSSMLHLRYDDIKNSEKKLKEFQCNSDFQWQNVKLTEAKIERAKYNKDIELILKSLKNENKSDYSYDEWFKIACCFKGMGVSVDEFIEWTGKAKGINVKHEDEENTIRKTWNSIQYYNVPVNYILNMIKKTDKKFTDKLTATFCNVFTVKDNSLFDQHIKETCGFDMAPVINNNIPREIYNERYIKPYNFDNCDMIFLKSMLGTGKTQALKQLLDTGKYNSVLYLSSRILFGYNIQGEFKDYGFKLYKESSGDLKDNRLICSIESVSRITKKSYDLVVADEWVSLLAIFSSSHCGSSSMPFENTVNTFSRLMTKSKRVIMCDAFMNNASFNAAQQFAALRKKYQEKREITEKRGIIKVCVNSWKPEERNCYKLKCDRSLLGVMMKQQAQNKKSFVVSATKGFADKAFTTLGGYNKGVMYYYGGMEDEGDFGKKTCLDTRKHWGEASNVVITPAITCGVNYDREGFDSKFMYCSSYSAVCRDLIQSSYRVRSTATGELYVAVSTARSNADKIIELAKLKKQLKSEFKKDKMPRWLKQVHVSNLQERNLSSVAYDKVLSYYLNELNYKVTKQDVDISKVKDIDTDSVVSGSTTSFEYDDVPDITKKEALEIEERVNTSKTRSVDNLKLRKYFLNKCIPENATPEQKRAIWGYTKSSVCYDTFKRAVAYSKGEIEKLQSQHNKNRTYESMCDEQIKIIPEVKKLIDTLKLCNEKKSNSLPENILTTQYDKIKKHIENIENILTIEVGEDFMNNKKRRIPAILPRVNHILNSHMGLQLKTAKTAKGIAREFTQTIDGKKVSKARKFIFEYQPGLECLFK